ncbi:50S ribosomal protein L2 [Candidatus Woesearchaeota archaeon]|nr:50S ribosomal protein L2 [Candidatus Woesearchaeota archaeon]
MGKDIIAQRRGKGSPRYTALSFKFVGEAAHRKISKQPVSGKVADIVHCPGHSAPLGMIKYDDGEDSIMIAPDGLKVGDEIVSGKEAPVSLGNVLSLRNIPEGTIISNVESCPGDGGKFARSSGTFAKVVARTEKSVKVLMPSGKEKELNPDCRAQIGTVAGSGRTEKPFTKAGAKYHARHARNKMYPTVCGVSMNAVDHPYGGKSSHHKGRPTIADKNAPAGRKVGKIRPRRTGFRR